MNTKDFTHTKWLLAAVICIVVAVFLLIGSFTFFKDVHNVETNVSFGDKAYLSFSANSATPGTPLTVSLNGGDDSDAVYQWTIGDTVIKNNSNTYTPTKDDLEKFISVSVTYEKTGTLSASLYCSKLPVIYINASEDIGDEYVSGTMAMQGNSTYTVENTDFYFGDVFIKLRGNSTKYREKAPYKIKLEKSTDLYGMGSNKHWVLLANDIDHTHIRNRLLYDFSRDIGAKYYMDSLNVILILDNEYRGVYQLSEQIRIADERLDIYDWEKLAKEAAAIITTTKAESESLNDEAKKFFLEEATIALSTDFSWITAPYTVKIGNDTYDVSEYIDIPSPTGGFLLEMDFYSAENPNGIKTNYQQPFYFSAPEFGYTNNALKNYAYTYIQSFEYALHSNDHIFHTDAPHDSAFGRRYDPINGWTSKTQSVFYSDRANDGKHYSEMFDMNSLLVNFFVCELSMNWDSMKNSTFVTKDIEGLAYLSPAWDFDWAFGNDNMYRIDTDFPTDWHTTNNYFTNEQFYQSVQWNRYLIKDPYFLFLAYNKYKEIRPTVIEDLIKDGGVIDTYYEENLEAGMANDALWHRTYRDYGGKNYSDSMKFLKDFIVTRVEWMDKQFESLETFVNSLGYYKANDSINITATYNDDDTITYEVKCTDKSVQNFIFQINGTNVQTVYGGTDGYALITVKSSDLKEKGSNIIEVHGLDTYEQFIDNMTNYLIY